jgi:hypothetical protein
MSANGTSRRFAATRQFSRFRIEADIAPGDSERRMVRDHPAGAGRHQSMAAPVQPCLAAPCPRHATPGPRNNPSEPSNHWYRTRGLEKATSRPRCSAYKALGYFATEHAWAQPYLYFGPVPERRQMSDISLLCGVAVICVSVFGIIPAMAGCNSGSARNTNLLSSASCQANGSGPFATAVGSNATASVPSASAFG